ncbi:MAG: redox-regulated ATPase YchF [Methylacidiphilales bacterium]|nr:redox-regulated ATPase YchF [Candidatus Methylacidiphilales bacterium]
MLRSGIVGLPNVGKSTLFNAVTKTRKAQAANYPFCTIDPNVGVVVVPDARLDVLAGISKTQKIVPATIEIVDIAGLVKGASQGEGLGNQFLSHIREVDAIVQVVRCFEDADIHHVSGSVDPLRDIEVILTELVLADMASVQKQKDRVAKSAKSGDKKAKAEVAILEKLEPHLNSGKPAVTLALNPDEAALAKGFFLLSAKPTLFACNVKEEDLATLSKGDRSTPTGLRVKQVEDYCATHLQAEAVIISAQIESELVDLPPEDQQAYLKDLGVEESGVGKLIRAVYHLLGLRTYFTTGEKETRAWTIHVGDKAPAAAGVIHSDFERGFIAAECTAYEDLKTLGSFAKCREAGKLRIEGKEYPVADGDVMEFRFNV